MHSKLLEGLLFIAAIVIVLFVVIMTCSQVQFTPYSQKTVFSKWYSKYENFDNPSTTATTTTTEEKVSAPSDETSLDSKKKKTDFIKKPQPSSSSSVHKKSEGFQGLMASSYGENNLPFEPQLLQGGILTGTPYITYQLPQSNSEEKQKVEGFQGLLSSPYSNAANQTMDPFWNNDASPECISKSSGLFNSKGGLCLSSQQTNLLKTRGGNASGGESQIGPA
jgi:hypothetical protein